MAITYRSPRRLIQPLFERYRNTFRGPRSSHLENLEMGKTLIDIKRLEEKVDYLNEKVYSDIQIFIGQVDPEEAPVHEEYEDGKYYVFDGILVEYYGDSATPSSLSIDTISTLSSKLSKIHRKIITLEQKKV
jgi:hypothetical protein